MLPKEMSENATIPAVCSPEVIEVSEKNLFLFLTLFFSTQAKLYMQAQRDTHTGVLTKSPAEIPNKFRSLGITTVFCNALHVAE